MSRYESAEEREMCGLLDRMTAQKEFWHSSVPSEIKFQRFGFQLREADFEHESEQEKVIYRGFHLRNRNEVAIANSGLSIVKNGKKEFEIQLDVWPFHLHDISVMSVPGKYVSIAGEHRLKQEDASTVSRKFQRYYLLPKGTTFEGTKCVYSNWIVTVRVAKDGVSDESRESETVPINLASCTNEPLPTDEPYNEEELPNIKAVPITSQDDADTDPRIVIPVATEDSKNEESSKSETEQAPEGVSGATEGSKGLEPDNEDESEPGSKGTESSESTPVNKEKSTSEEMEG